MSLVFAIEPVETAWNEVMVLAQAHWAGTKGYRRHMPFQPLYARYQACEASGFYRLVTARDAGTLAGYFGFYLSPSMHSQHLMATEDTFFLLPEYRKGRNALRFIKFIETLCQEAGVVEIMFSCEIDNPVANALLAYLDYRPVIQQYSKMLVPSLTTEVDHVCTITAASS